MTDTTHLERAMESVPRGVFVTPELSEFADEDVRLPLPEGQSTPPPSVIREILDALDPQPGERILQVGTGSGYTAAILGQIVDEVFTVERLRALALSAKERLEEFGADNVRVFLGNGLRGLKSFAPFDGIVVSATVDHVPERLLDQLEIGGRMVLIRGPHEGLQRLVVVRKTADDTFEEEQVGSVRFVELLGDVIVDMGAGTREEVELAAQHARATDARIGEELIQRGVVEESELYRALARQRGMRLATVDEVMEGADFDLARSIPRAFLERHRCIPLRKEDGRAVVATSETSIPSHDLRQALDVDSLELFLITPSDYRRIWSVIDLSDSGEEPELIESGQESEELISTGTKFQSRMVDLFEAVLLDAIGERASDIHFERYDDDVRVRFRVDGRLRDIGRYHLSPRELRGVVNVVKVAADMDITEKRLPQGGRLRRRTQGRVFDLRVQSQPALHGEHLIIRLLPQDAELISIEDLGFPDDLAESYRRLLKNPQGMLLVVGPTGSGKSTTLYAGLQVLAKDGTRKVITAEDPIEYSIRGVQQTQVHPEISFHFADAMRAFVREDPDVILIGEIRDSETALEAIRASQTGHLVLSTLHCNDAVDAVQRLFDLGMHPNSLASELMAVFSQRLVRRICTECREEVSPDPELVQEIFGVDGPPDDFKTFTGTGCNRCGGHGTRGRVAMMEYLEVGEALRMSISRRLTVDELRHQARGEGLRSIRSSALSLVMRGLVPLDELPRVLTLEQLRPAREFDGPAAG